MMFFTMKSKPNSALFMTDISGDMLAIAQKRFTAEDSVYGRIPGNKFILSEPNPTCVDVPSLISTHCSPTSKLAYACQANNEKLPFPSDCFQAYIANLSLMLVDNP